MPFAESEGRVYHYLLEGPVDKPVLVFANSLGTDLRIWDGMVAELRSKLPILRYDKRGHGLSDSSSPPYTIDDLSRDLLALLDLLAIRDLLLCGISVGGMIAQRVALSQPERVRGLILCDTAARIGSVAAWQDRIALVESGGLEAVVGVSMERWFTAGFRATRGTDARGYANMLRRTSVDGYIGICQALRDADFTAEVARIEAPALVLCGDQDVSTPPANGEELARRMPRARFSLIKDAAHLPCIEQPSKVVAQMLQFFSEVKLV
jgi:3-oxoadipate enol-lactonase